MTRAERIKALKEEMLARDYEGVTTLMSASIFDLLDEYKYSCANLAKAIKALKKIANMPEQAFSFHKLYSQAQTIARDAVAEIHKSDQRKMDVE